jgi:hypothetical protein
MPHVSGQVASRPFMAWKLLVVKAHGVTRGPREKSCCASSGSRAYISVRASHRDTNDHSNCGRRGDELEARWAVRRHAGRREGKRLAGDKVKPERCRRGRELGRSGDPGRFEAGGCEQVQVVLHRHTARDSLRPAPAHALGRLGGLSRCCCSVHHGLFHLAQVAQMEAATWLEDPEG